MKKNIDNKADVIKSQIADSIRTKELFLDEGFIGKILKVSNLLVGAIRKKHRVFLCGNGGSAADCQHWAAEMTGRFLKERRAIGFISLTTNTSEITAIGNDYSFDTVFSRQIEGLGEKGDVLICISTSGKSKNLISAAETAKKTGMKVVSLTGKSPNPMSLKADIEISVPAGQTPRIQEGHSLIMHLLCYLVEDALFAKKIP